MAPLTSIPTAIAIIATTSMALEPWAETRELTDCAKEPSTCAIRSSWEIVLHPFSDIRPSDASFSNSEGMDRSIFGRRFSVLEGWSTDRTGVGLSVGNETGDQVLQEVRHGSAGENSNPATSLWFSTPADRGLRAFGRFEQVDHFSDSWLGKRSRMLGSPNLSSPWPDRRYAWFGENLPPFSLAGAGIGSTRDGLEVDASFLDGWLWQHLPLSDGLMPWKLVQFDARAAFRNHLSWSHRRQLLRSEADRSRQILSNGELVWSPMGDSSLGVGSTYEFVSLRGMTESDQHAVGALLRLRLLRGRWMLAGWNHLDARGHAIRDTASWSDTLGTTALGMSVAAGTSDRPDGIRPEWENSLVGGAPRGSSAEERFLRLEARCSRTTGPVAWEARLIPWIINSPFAYPGEAGSSWHQPVALKGNVYGAKARLSAKMETASKGFEIACQHASQTGRAADSVDLTPPSWVGTATGWTGSELGLSLRAGLSWSSSWMVRNLPPTPRRIPSSIAGNAWLEQMLFSDRLRLSLAALDLFAADVADLSNGGQRRTRILVSANWQL